MQAVLSNFIPDYVGSGIKGAAGLWCQQQSHLEFVVLECPSDFLAPVS